MNPSPTPNKAVRITPPFEKRGFDIEKQKASVRAALTKHGMSDTKTYGVWQGMVSRCKDKNCNTYKNYGGRGITVCDRWLTFELFFEDMGACPDGLSLDRRDNNLGYSKDNCRWATRHEQANNMRSNVFITHKGKTQTIQQWSRETGINHRTLGERIRGGWPIEAALSTPASKSNKKTRYYEHSQNN